MIIQCPQYKFDFERLKRETIEIVDRYPELSQIGMTHSDKEMSELEKLTDCVGSMYDYDARNYKFTEADFPIFNEAYKNTSLYELYSSIPNLGRFRIMVMHGPKCYSIHRDVSQRYHVAIETNENCLFLFPGMNAQLHIPADGNLYKLDTRLKHTFVNGSRRRRIHLVFNEIEEPK
jgi:hypothetical protein